MGSTAKTISLGADTFEYLLVDGDDSSRSPTLVFLNGFRMPFSSWDRLLPIIEHRGKMFFYNRLGIGHSSKAIQDQDGETVIRSLRQLLVALDLKPPYIFVAHSFGGLFANLYGCQYPEELAGTVLVESSHPEEVLKQRALPPPPPLHIINNGLKTVEKLFNTYKYSEDECVLKTVEQIEKADLFPDIPLSIVTGKKKPPFIPKANFDLHLAFQEELLDYSPNSKQYEANNSSHFPQITEPEFVLKAIEETIQQSTAMN